MIFKNTIQRFKHNDMNMILLIVWAFFTSISCSFSQNVKWLTWDEAVAATQKLKSQGKKGKIIFVDIYTDWCSWCKKMEQNTFEQPEIAQLLNTYFLPVKLNAEQKADITFNGTVFKYVVLQSSNGKYGIHRLAYSLMDFRVQYPTVVFLDSEFHTIQIIPGFIDSLLFQIVLNYMTSDQFGLVPFETWREEKKNIHQVKD
jgi:thioredoxin-related protein